MHPIGHAAVGVIIMSILVLVVALLSQCKFRSFLIAHFTFTPLYGFVAALPDLVSLYTRPQIDHEWWANFCALHKWLDETGYGIGCERELVFAAMWTAFIAMAVYAKVTEKERNG